MQVDVLQRGQAQTGRGVVARAADRLRIRRTTLVEKMRKYGMSRRDEEASLDG